MKNERLNVGHRFGPSFCKPCTRKKPRSELFQKSREQLRRTREYFRPPVPNRSNNANKRDVDVAEEACRRNSRTYDSSNTIEVNDQHNGVASKMRQIPFEEPSNARVAPQPNDLNRPPSSRLNNGSSRLNNGAVPSQINIKKSRPSSVRPNSVVFSRQGSFERSRLSSLRLSNDMVPSQRNAQRSKPSSLRRRNDMVSLQRNIEKSRTSSLGPSNDMDMVSSWWNTERSRTSFLGPSNDMVSPRRNNERSRPSSSRFKNGSVSSRRNPERSRLSFSRSNTDIVLAQKNVKKSKLSFSRANTQKNTESRPFSSRPNSGLVTLQKNIEKSRLSRSKDGFSSGKLDKLHSVGSKDNSNLKLGILKESYPSPMVNSSSIKQTVSSKVHSEDNWMAKEAPNPILEGNQVEQDRRSGNTSPVFGKDLSSHQAAKASCMSAKMQQNGESLDGCIELDSRNQNTSLAEDGRTDDDNFKSKRKETLWEGKLVTGEDDEREEAENRRPTKRRRRYIAIEDEEDDGDQNVVGVECGSEEAENCRSSKKRRRYIANEDEEDDGDQNPVGVEGAIAGLTTEAATEFPEPFVSDSVKLQHCSFLPIDEPVWSGILKVGSKEYVSLAAHLSAKCCEKAWKLSRSLQRVVEVTKLSRLEAWPKSFEASNPTNDNIALYFLPRDMRPNEYLDQLVKEVMENDMVLRAVVGEAEMLIFPSVLLPEQHQTFRKKPYLWGVFKRREDKDTIVDEQHGMGHRAQDKEMGKQPASHRCVGKDGYRAADLNIDLGLEGPVEVGRQGMEQEPNAPHLADGTAQPNSAPTGSTATPSNHGQMHSSLGVSSGAVFGFVIQQTPRVEKLIQEMERAGAVVVAMRGELIASGLGQPTATG